MNLEELMKIDINNLAQKQYKAYEQHVIDILDNIKKCIIEKRFNDIKTFESRLGDGYGDDNTCIDFGYKGMEEMDISDVINKLKSLEILK
jgi:hypothetical protein